MRVLSLRRDKQKIIQLKKLIVSKAASFSIEGLIDQLFRIGYTWDSLKFRGVQSFVSQVSLIHKVEFEDEPQSIALVHVNFGLLSPQSPLPSYFFQEMEKDSFRAELFLDFISWFDQTLIEEYITNLYPEFSPKISGYWEGCFESFFSLVNMKSPTTIKWLFDLVYPELGCIVEKMPLKRVLYTDSIRLGKTTIGDNSGFNGKSRVSVTGLRVTLFSETEFFRPGMPWAEEIIRRIQRDIFPHIGSLKTGLDIFLVISTQKSFATLDKTTYLGYDKLKGGKENLRRIRIISGCAGSTKSLKKNSDDLKGSDL
jgi:hypothetical protein